MKKTKKSKVFLVTAIVFGVSLALYSVIFPFYRIADYVIGLAVACALSAIANTMAKGLDTSKEAPSQQPIPQTGNAAVDSLVQKGQEMLQEIRAENERIPDAELTEKINQLEDVANRIFRTVADQPAKAPQIKRFMDYYLPTTLKMLTGYRKMDERKVTGQNAAATREQIKDAMDVVLKAFNKQLDTMYQDDMLDISTDIDVLETMLKQDGLIENKLNSYKNISSAAKDLENASQTASVKAVQQTQPVEKAEQVVEEIHAAPTFSSVQQSAGQATAQAVMPQGDQELQK